MNRADLPARPTAAEAIRTVFAGGAVVATGGAGYGLWTATRMFVIADPFGAMFESVLAVLLIGMGGLAMAASFLAHHIHTRYTVKRREPVATDGGNE